jgi:acyl carrier protein
MRAIIKEIVDREARLHIAPVNLTADADLFALGLTPYSAVRVMLALEHELGVEFPRQAMKRETMSSIAAIECALSLAMPVTPAAA